MACRFYSQIVMSMTLVLALAWSGGSVSAQVLQDFGAGLESWRFDFGAGGNIVYDPTEGSPGNAIGAAKLTFDFPGGGIAFTTDIFPAETDLTGSAAVSYDIKVDTANSSLDAFGNYGFMEFVSRETSNYTWGSQSGANLAAESDWQTFSVPTTGDGLGMSQTRAFTLQIYGGVSQNIPDDVVVWIDNVRLVPIPEPSTLVLATVLSVVGVAGFRRR